jgi:hypothetical protein
MPDSTRMLSMHSDVIYSFGIGFGGAILFLLVDKYEKDVVVAVLLKAMVFTISGVAILHRLRTFGISLF